MSLLERCGSLSAPSRGLRWQKGKHTEPMNPVRRKQDENHRDSSVYKLRSPVLKSKAKETWCMLNSGDPSSCWDGNILAECQL